MTSTLRNRGFGFALGLLTFVGAHTVEVAMWAVWFGGVHDPWFLNSGKAAAFTVACLFGTSAIGGGLGLPGLAITAGAATAMTAVLAWQGGSTIFPIVLAFGWVTIAFSSLLGAWIGADIAAIIRPRRPPDS